MGRISDWISNSLSEKFLKELFNTLPFRKSFWHPKLSKTTYFLKDRKLIYRKRQEGELLCLDCSWPLPLAINCCSDCLFILSPEDVSQIRDMWWCWKLKDNSFNTPGRPQQGSIWELCCQCGVGCHPGCSPGKVHLNLGNTLRCVTATLNGCKNRQLHSYQKHYFVFTKMKFKTRFAIYCSLFIKLFYHIYLHNSILLLKIWKKHLSFDWTKSFKGYNLGFLKKTDSFSVFWFWRFSHLAE